MRWWNKCYTTASRGISSFTLTYTTLDSCITYTYCCVHARTCGSGQNIKRSYHLAHIISPDLVSVDLISSELGAQRIESLYSAWSCSPRLRPIRAQSVQRNEVMRMMGSGEMRRVTLKLLNGKTFRTRLIHYDTQQLFRCAAAHRKSCCVS